MQLTTRFQQFGKLLALGLLPSTFWVSWARASVALPPVEDKPEEVLRAEIILEARSPIDGKPLSAAEYALLQEELGMVPPTVKPPVSPKLRETINLLRIRKFIKTFFPFIPLR